MTIICILQCKYMIDHNETFEANSANCCDILIVMHYSWKNGVFLIVFKVMPCFFYDFLCCTDFNFYQYYLQGRFMDTKGLHLPEIPPCAGLYQLLKPPLVN